VESSKFRLYKNKNKGIDRPATQKKKPTKVLRKDKKVRKGES
jgi:hypothetical protein